jgi:hypothetical protein
MSKGSSQRPTNKKAFDNQYDAIFGKGSFEKKVVRNKQLSLDRVIEELEAFSLRDFVSDDQELIENAISLLQQYRGST